jgi:hypothetical protein
MASKRLNVGHRDALKGLADKLIAQTTDTSALDAAYTVVAKTVNKLMEKRYPAEDMAVLKRYGQAQADSCIYVSTGGSDYDRFSFRADDPLIPIRPGSRNTCNNRTPLYLEGKDGEAWAAYRAAKKADEDGRQQRRNDFHTLINHALTFEELLALWPAADALRERILGTSRAISVMSEDVVARIRADAAISAELPA